VGQLFTWIYINQTTSWLVRSWNTFGTRMNHEQPRTHKTHHGLNLREATTFPFIIFFVPNHRACIQMSFCLGIPNLGVSKFSKLGLLWLWKPITYCANLRLKWGLKQSYNSYRKLSKSMWHTTWTLINYGDYWLLVVGNQIGNLTPDLSFGHNLCFKYPKWVMQAHFRHLCLQIFPMV